MKLKIVFLLIPFCICASYIQAQSRSYNLEGLISLAFANSPEAGIAKTKYKNSEWIYRAFRAGLKPKIRFNGTLPKLNRSIENVIQDDGTQGFRERAVLSNGLEVNIEQVIPATGGRVFFSSALERLDIFGLGRSSNYLSTPLSFGFIQPLSGYNAVKWNTEIKPLELDYASIAFFDEQEQIALQVVQAFFKLWLSIQDEHLAENNLQLAKELLAIGQKRFDKAFIPKSDLIQLKLANLDAQSRLSDAQVNQEILQEELRTIIGMDSKETLVLEDLQAPDFEIPESIALELFRVQNPIHKENNIQQLRAEENLDQAKSLSKEINLIGQIGFTQTGSTVAEAYRDPKLQGILDIGIEIPIADWGVRRAHVEMAKAEFELQTQNSEKLTIQMERELLVNVKRFSLLKEQLLLAEEVIMLADENFELNQKQYLASTITYNDLTTARLILEEKRRAYNENLQAIWQTYYQIRRSCLYDFKNRRNLLDN